MKGEKTWEKKKMPITSIFSLLHIVFTSPLGVVKTWWYDIWFKVKLGRSSHLKAISPLTFKHQINPMNIFNLQYHIDKYKFITIFCL